MEKDRRRARFIAALSDSETELPAVGVPDYFIFELVQGKSQLIAFLFTAPPGVTYSDYNARTRAELYLRAMTKHRFVRRPP